MQSMQKAGLEAGPCAAPVCRFTQCSHGHRRHSYIGGGEKIDMAGLVQAAEDGQNEVDLISTRSPCTTPLATEKSIVHGSFITEAFILLSVRAVRGFRLLLSLSLSLSLSSLLDHTHFKITRGK